MVYNNSHQFTARGIFNLNTIRRTDTPQFNILTENESPENPPQHSHTQTGDRMTNEPIYDPPTSSTFHWITSVETKTDQWSGRTVVEIKSGLYLCRSGTCNDSGTHVYRETSTCLGVCHTTSFPLSSLWSIVVPPKVKSLLWRLASSALPVGSLLKLRGLSNGICCVCGLVEESWGHLFFECSWLAQLWPLFPQFQAILSYRHTSFLDLCALIRDSKIQEDSLFFLILWFIWLARNNRVFNGNEPSVLRIYHQTLSLFDAFRMVSLTDENSPEIVPFPTRWIRPKKESLKVNVDAGYCQGIGPAGIVIRDHSGALVSALTFNLGRSASPEHAELTTILEGVMEAARIWSGSVVIESDSLVSISKITGEDEDISLWAL